MRQKGFSSVAILVIMVFLIALGGLGIFFMPQIKAVFQQAPSATQPSSQTTVQGKYVEQVLDMAPAVPAAQKTAVIIEKSDSSVEKVLLPTTSVSAYISALPVGTKVLSKTPVVPTQ